MRFLKKSRCRPGSRGPVLGTALLLLAGCSTLPSSGPTGSQVRNEAPTATLDQGANGIRVVELQDMATLPAALEPPAVFASTYAPPPTDMIGPGDVLDIAIYETGVTLFAGSADPASGAASPIEPASKVERLPPARVDDNGNISLPYIGRMRAAGHTSASLAGAIRQGYRGMSQNPQVLVSLREVVRNTVIIGGDVARPGRMALSTNRETLSDAVAMAGGYRGDAKELSVRVQREDQTAEFRLSDVLTGSLQDMRIYPGDRISIIRAPRTFSVMGAPGRVEQIAFSGPSLSLAEAIAQSGGVNPNIGDPKAIFVFRFVTAEDGTEQPVVYHINMMKAQSYFIAQRFAMIDKDVLYVGNARANQPSKLLQIISQLFGPIILVRDIVRN